MCGSDHNTMKTTTVTAMAKKTKNRTTELTLKAKASSNGSANGHVSNGHAKQNSSNGNIQHDGNNEDILSGSEESKEVVVVKSQSPPWKETFDRICDQAFNLAGFAYLSAIGGMAWYFMRQSNIDFVHELQSSVRLMLFHQNGVPFFGMLAFMIVLRWIINRFGYPIILRGIYEGKNHKYTGYFCEWLFDAIKNTVLFSLGAYVAYGSDWWPTYQPGSWGWYPPQGGTVFDSNGEIVPTCALALETIGHFEVTVDFVALLTLVYDTVTEYYETKALQLRHGSPDEKQASTTTSFAEDFVHHTGVVFGALFLYITAKDNCNAIAIIVLLGQFNDMCEFAALTLGLCKNWFLERVVTPTLCVFWTISLFYIWPAALIPIFFEAIPIEHSFDPILVLQLTLYQFGSLFIALLFWAMHMFWLYKGLLFLYRYQRGVSFAEKKLEFKKNKGETKEAAALSFDRSSCLASGTILKPEREE
jgi:hypothetical protein